MRKSFSAKICLSGHSRPPSAHTALPIVSENSSQVLEAPSCQRRYFHRMVWASAQLCSPESPRAVAVP